LNQKVTDHFHEFHRNHKLMKDYLTVYLQFKDTDIEKMKLKNHWSRLNYNLIVRKIEENSKIEYNEVIKL
jgi:hypothetical protein